MICRGYVLNAAKNTGEECQTDIHAPLIMVHVIFAERKKRSQSRETLDTCRTRAG